MFSFWSFYTPNKVDVPKAAGPHSREAWESGLRRYITRMAGSLGEAEMFL
jgi:hypothetical protein